jgi:hypothetical protein
VVTNWFPVTKNQTYFAYRHALGSHSEHEITERVIASVRARVEDARLHEAGGLLPAGSAAQAVGQCSEGLRIGSRLGLDRRTLRLGPVDWPAPRFDRFPTVDTSRRRKLTFVSSDYSVNSTETSARFIRALAPALARRGHEVRVITSAIEQGAVDLEEGVWVHRVDTTRVDDHTFASVREIERIGAWTAHDLVCGPLSDAEMLGAVRGTCLPSVVHVATADADNESGQSHLSEADLFYSDSHSVIESMEYHFHTSIDNDRSAEGFERFLERVQLSDISRALDTEAAGFEHVRGSSGRPAAMVRAGGRVRLPIDDATSARLCITVTRPTTIVVDSGIRARAHRLEPGRVHRIDVDTSQTTVEVRVVHGSAVVDGLVVIGDGRR